MTLGAAADGLGLCSTVGIAADLRVPAAWRPQADALMQAEVASARVEALTMDATTRVRPPVLRVRRHQGPSSPRVAHQQHHQELVEDRRARVKVVGRQSTQVDPRSDERRASDAAIGEAVSSKRRNTREARRLEDGLIHEDVGSGRPPRRDQLAYATMQPALNDVAALLKQRDRPRAARGQTCEIQRGHALPEPAQQLALSASYNDIDESNRLIRLLAAVQDVYRSVGDFGGTGEDGCSKDEEDPDARKYGRN